MNIRLYYSIIDGFYCYIIYAIFIYAIVYDSKIIILCIRNHIM